MDVCRIVGYNANNSQAMSEQVLAHSRDLVSQSIPCLGPLYSVELPEEGFSRGSAHCECKGRAILCHFSGDETVNEK